jgi:hypothetical protein
MNEAEEKFREAAMAFKQLDDKFRAEGIGAISANDMQAILIDLDAAIPGLTELMLGRALVLKGDLFFRMHLFSLRNQRLYDPDAPTPLLDEGLPHAKKGLGLLEKHGASPRDLAWATSVVQKMGK